jgi:undecaprenyl diphosphate synthase
MITCFNMSIHKRIQNKIQKHTTNLGVKGLNQLNLPNALLIIPDGNRRWAKAHHLAPEKGHWAGGDTVVKMLTVFKDLNVKVIGLWAFGEDNWKREKHEVDNVMAVVKSVTEKSLETMKKWNIKFVVVGKQERIKKEYPELFAVLENAQKETAHQDSKIFAVFLDYGERLQLEEFAKAREMDDKSSTYEILSKINGGLPLFDMVLRTSGELRFSGFGPMVSVAELVAVKKNLPEVSTADIVLAFKEYSSRKRRLGN